MAIPAKKPVRQTTAGARAAAPKSRPQPAVAPKPARPAGPKPVTRWPALALGAPLGFMAAAVFAGFAVMLPVWYADFGIENAKAGEFLTREGIPHLAAFVRVALAALTIVSLTACFRAFRRCAASLRLLRVCCGCGYAVATLYAYAVWRFTELLFSNEIEIAGSALTRVEVFFWRWQLTWPLLVIVPVFAIVHLLSWRARNIWWYTGTCEEYPAPGDRLIEELRTHGEDPRFRKASYGSAITHLAVIVIIPWLLGFFGCVEDYRVPKGSGDPVVALVQIVKPQKKPKKRYILRPDSVISFHVPDLDDSDVIEQVEKVSQVTYKADLNARAGKMGAGGKGQGGWPNGMDKALVRFIRLEYAGKDWDDGMDMQSRADMNFLDEFHKLTGFKIAKASESHPIGHLAKYSKGYAPPFVYMTGSANINVSQKEIKVLREYLLGGGMLVADCGSPQWDRNFRALIAQVMPGNPLRDIADDDPIYQIPFRFQNGAPSLWHHGGYRALGIKHQARWVVFYHPGDLKDAWKTGQHGLRPELAKAAMHLGVNIIYYSFTNYLKLTEKYRK